MFCGYVEISASPGSTDAVPEGAANLYHTTARAAAAAPVHSIAGRTGAVVLTKADVGLGNVDNTADSAKAVASAGKLTAARTISLTGGVTGSVTTDLSGNAAIAVSVTQDANNRFVSDAEKAAWNAKASTSDIGKFGVAGAEFSNGVNKITRKPPSQTALFTT